MGVFSCGQRQAAVRVLRRRPPYLGHALSAKRAGLTHDCAVRRSGIYSAAPRPSRFVHQRAREPSLSRSCASAGEGLDLLAGYAFQRGQVGREGRI